MKKIKNTPLRVGKRFDKLCPRSPERVSDRSLKVEIGENSNVCVRVSPSEAVAARRCASRGAGSPRGLPKKIQSLILESLILAQNERW